MPNLFKGVVKLTEDQYKTLLQGGSFEVDGQTITYDANTLYVTDYSIDTQLDINSENPVTNKAIATAISNLESSVASNGVTINTDQDISGNKNFTGEVTKNGVNLATIDDVPIVSDTLKQEYKNNALSVNQGIILNDKITTLMENVNGRVQSFSVANLEALGTLFNIDVSEIKDEYVIPSKTITYKEKEYTLKTGDIFLIVDVAVPDYWFSLDDMKLFKLETSKVDLTKYVDTETDQTIGGNKTFTNSLSLNDTIGSNSDLQITFKGKGENRSIIRSSSNGSLINQAIYHYFATLENGKRFVINPKDMAINPENDGGYSVGQKDKRFKNLYLSENLSDGTNSIAIKDIANKSSLEGLATEEYVRENGGKIDKVKVNGVEQTITDKVANLVIDIPEPETITDYYKVKNKLSAVDLNTVVVPGNYGVVKDCGNMPVAENGTLFVGNYDNNQYAQQIFVAGNNTMYIRSSTSIDNSTWSSWEKVAKDSKFAEYVKLDNDAHEFAEKMMNDSTNILNPIHCRTNYDVSNDKFTGQFVGGDTILSDLNFDRTVTASIILDSIPTEDTTLSLYRLDGTHQSFHKLSNATVGTIYTNTISSLKSAKIWTTMSKTNSFSFRLWINDGETGKTYFKYNSNKHITNAQAALLKEEWNRSANLFEQYPAAFDSGKYTLSYNNGEFYTTSAQFCLGAGGNSWATYEMNLPSTINKLYFRFKLKSTDTSVKLNRSYILTVDNNGQQINYPTNFYTYLKNDYTEYYGSVTLTSTVSNLGFVVYFDNSNSSTIYAKDFMISLVENVYQPYNGEIVHKNDLSSYLPLSGGTITGDLIINGVDSSDSRYRSTIKQISPGNTPTDLIMGSNGEGKWSMTCRDSSESYRLGIYNYKLAAFAAAIDFNTNAFIFSKVPNVNGTDVALMSNLNNYLLLDGSKTMTGKIDAPQGIKVGSYTSAYNENGVVFANTNSKIGVNRESGLLGLYTDSDLIFRPGYSSNSNNGIRLSASGFIPEITNTVDLGSSSKKYKSIYAAGSINVNKANINQGDANGGVVIKRTDTTSGGAFIDYYHNNQTTQFTRGGNFSDGSWGAAFEGNLSTSLRVKRDSTLIKNNNYTYTLPDKTGTVALTSDLSAYKNVISFSVGSDQSGLSSYWFPLWKQTKIVPQHTDVLYRLEIGNRYSDSSLGRGVLYFGFRGNSTDQSDVSVEIGVESGNVNAEKFKLIKKSDNMFELLVNVSGQWQYAIGQVVSIHSRTKILYEDPYGNFSNTSYATEYSISGTEWRCSDIKLNMGQEYIQWKEKNWGDGFRMTPNFNGSGSSNYLSIFGYVGAQYESIGSQGSKEIARFHAQSADVDIFGKLNVTGGATMNGALNLNGSYPQITTTTPDFIIQTSGGKQYEFNDTEFRPVQADADTLSIGRSDRKFKDGYFSGTVTAASFSGNATSATKATQDGSGNVIETTYAKKSDLTNSGPQVEILFEGEQLLEGYTKDHSVWTDYNNKLQVGDVLLISTSLGLFHFYISKLPDYSSYIPSGNVTPSGTLQQYVAWSQTSSVLKAKFWSYNIQLGQWGSVRINVPQNSTDLSKATITNVDVTNITLYRIIRIRAS